MMRRNLTLTLCLCALGVSLGIAEEFPLEPLGLTFSIPDEWTTEIEKGSLSAFSPDEKVILVFTLVEDENDLNEWREAMQNEVSNVEDRGGEREISLSEGLTATTREATGVIEGLGKADIGTFVIENKDKTLVITAAKSAAAATEFVQEAEEIIPGYQTHRIAVSGVGSSQGRTVFPGLSITLMEIS